jgi:hypothetical protein
VSVGYFAMLSVARPYGVKITVITYGTKGLSFRRHSIFAFVFIYIRNVQLFSLLFLFYKEGWACRIVMSASIRLINFEPIDRFHETWYQHQISLDLCTVSRLISVYTNMVVVGFYDVGASHDVGLWNSV